MPLKPRRQLALALLLVALVAGHHVQQAGATFFIIGGACVAGLEAARAILEATRLLDDLDRPIEQVEELCRLLQRFSLPGILLEDVLPLIERLVELTSQGAPNLPDPANLQEFREIVTNLAQVASG